MRRSSTCGSFKLPTNSLTWHPLRGGSTVCEVGPRQTSCPPGLEEGWPPCEFRPLSLTARSVLPGRSQCREDRLSPSPVYFDGPKKAKHAERAMKELDGKKVKGSRIRVRPAEKAGPEESSREILPGPGPGWGCGAHGGHNVAVHVRCFPAESGGGVSMENLFFSIQLSRV